MPPLRIAITGGGVAGASLMHALTLHPNIDAHIFEAAAEFREAGLAIGIARQAQEALELIGPSAIQALHDSGAVPSKGTWFMDVRTGEEIDRIDTTKLDRVESITQRADFLRSLLERVPRGSMHPGKQLVEILRDGDDGEITLKFADGSTHTCDVLIGADGIRSFVRKYVLDPSDPAASPRSAGWYTLWMMRPYEQARGILGEEYIDKDDHREIAWMGDSGTCIMHNISDGGKQVQFAACVWDEASKGATDWMKRVDVETEKKKFANWPQRFQTALGEFLAEEEEPKGIFFWEHLHAKTYVKGNVALMGDAAHGTTPWQGSGGGMSLEDSLMLSSLLSRCHSRSEVVTALEIYNTMRLPRTQKIVDSSREIGMISVGPEPIDAAKWKGKLAAKWDHIMYFDNRKSVEEAVGMFEEKVGRRV